MERPIVIDYWAGRNATPAEYAAEIERLQTENGKLRKIMCIAQEVVDSKRCGLVPGFKFSKLEQALAELAREGE